MAEWREVGRWAALAAVGGATGQGRSGSDNGSSSGSPTGATFSLAGRGGIEGEDICEYRDIPRRTWSERTWAGDIPYRAHIAQAYAYICVCETVEEAESALQIRIMFTLIHTY